MVCRVKYYPMKPQDFSFYSRLSVCRCTLNPKYGSTGRIHGLELRAVDYSRGLHPTLDHGPLVVLGSFLCNISGETPCKRKLMEEILHHIGSPKTL